MNRFSIVGDKLHVDWEIYVYVTHWFTSFTVNSIQKIKHAGECTISRGINIKSAHFNKKTRYELAISTLTQPSFPPEGKSMQENA